MESYREILYGRNGIQIVAEEDGRVAGSITVTTLKGNAHIGYIYIKSAYRGHELDSPLLDKAEQWAIGNKLRNIGGTLIPVPGSERHVVNLLDSKGYKVDKKGNFSKKLDLEIE